MKNAREEYGDIIDLEHFVSPDLSQMPRLNRAAQFSPFAALTGYEDLIDEAARQTSDHTELDESEKEEISRRLQALLRVEDAPPASITYYVPDTKKQGGAYQTVIGVIRKYDDYGRFVSLDTGDIVFVDDITSVSAECFEETTI